MCVKPVIEKLWGRATTKMTNLTLKIGKISMTALSSLHRKNLNGRHSCSSAIFHPPHSRIHLTSVVAISQSVDSCVHSAGTCWTQNPLPTLATLATQYHIAWFDSSLAYRISLVYSQFYSSNNLFYFLTFKRYLQQLSFRWMTFCRLVSTLAVVIKEKKKAATKPRNRPYSISESFPLIDFSIGIVSRGASRCHTARRSHLRTEQKTANWWMPLSFRHYIWIDE